MGRTEGIVILRSLRFNRRTNEFRHERFEVTYRVYRLML